VTEFFIYLPLGVVAGILAGLFGIGGGIIFVPVLILAFELIGMHGELLAHLSIGTSLACVVFTGLSSTLAHQRKGAVMWPWVIKKAPFLVVGGAIGGWTADQLPGQILIVMLGTFLLITSFQLFFKNQVHSEGEVIRMPSVPVFAFKGTLTGWISSMMGIAGGALTVPFMTSHGAPVRCAIGTASAFGIPIALAGTVSFIFVGLDHPNRPDWAFGYVYLPAFLGIIATSTVSARLGAYFAHALDQKLLQRLFACFLAILSIRLIWNSVI
jgi:uncharacterized membrane protein YfcA